MILLRHVAESEGHFSDKSHGFHVGSGVRDTFNLPSAFNREGLRAEVAEQSLLVLHDDEIRCRAN